MGRVKGQASPDFVMSAMIFSLAALFIFSHLTRTYYSRIWEISRVGGTAGAQNLAMFIVSEEGNWSSNPFESNSLAFGGTEVNETRMNYFFGMPYQHVQNRLVMTDEFRIEVWKLPSIGITSDVEELYLNDTVDINFQTTVNSSFMMVLVGTQGSEGYALWNQSTGKYHDFQLNIPGGTYSLKALATAGEEYGAYEAIFRVVR